MKRFLLVIATPLITFLMIAFVILVESEYLYNVISGTPSPIEEWLDIFKSWSIYIIVSSALSILLWYVLAQWIFKLNNWKNAGKRLTWLLLFTLPIITTIAAILFTPTTQEGIWYAYLFYVCSAIIPYYVGTVFFSPSSFKYSPIGAKHLRRGW